MRMRRYYFTSDSLEDLDGLEAELEAKGIPKPQIHVLSMDDTSVETHPHLNEVQAFLKTDVIYSGLRGALFGGIAAALVLEIAGTTGLAHSVVGWVPWIFLAVILFGFFTWEGGLLGIQRRNTRFKRFEEILASGKHVFFVDLEPSQEPILQQVLDEHPTARSAGVGVAAPHWLVQWRMRLQHFFVETMP